MKFKIIAAVVVIVVAGGVFLLLRMRKPRLAPAVPGEETSMSEEQSLLLELATLDDAHQAGKISEDEYKRVRADRKAKLIKLLNESKGEGNAS